MHAAETAVVSHRGNRRYASTYGELAELAGRSAAELERRGIAPGERVVLWGENSAEWIAVFYGCLLRGVIAVPLDAAGSSDFANRIVKEVAPKLIVGDSRLLASLEGSVPRLLLSELDAQLPVQPIFAVSDSVNGEAPVQIVFTSGTTAEPKGIVLTHRNVLASLKPIEDEIKKYLKYERWVHPLRFLHTLPLSHVFGQFMGLWVPPLLAAEIHFGAHLEPSRITELIRRERVSVLVAVPRILHLLQVHLFGRFSSLAQDLERATGLSIWKRWWHFRKVHHALGWKFWAVVSGGARLPMDLEDFWSRLGFALIQGYGMTETTALVTLNHPFRIGHGTIGKPLPGREVRISDDGEIFVRGDMLSAATWRAGAIHPRVEEWLATGDLATKEESGELRFLGRKGDVIVTGSGMNVHPSDVEEAMAKQPGVRECVVVPCETMSGSEPVAVVLFSGTDDELHLMINQANRELAEYQQIRRALRWPKLQFPRTSTEKLLRREVRQWACDAILSRGQAGNSAAGGGEDVLLDIIASITGEPPLDGSDQLRLSEDLHLDSLGRVQLQSTLQQQLGLEMEDGFIAKAETLGDLRKLLKQEEATALASYAASNTKPSRPVPMPTVSPPIVSGPSFRRPETGRPAEHLYPRWPWSWPVHAVRIVFLELVMRPLVWLLAAPQVVRGMEQLPPTPLLIVANHVTAYDGALILYALPGRLRRQVAIAMAGEMLLDYRRGRNQPGHLQNLFSPVGYWLVTALFNVFPLPRLRGFQKSFAHAGEAMDRGYSVLIFPEGTRSRDGKLQAFKAGTGLLAEQSRVPVVPVALVGLGEIRAQGARWFRSGRLEVHIGEAITVEEGTDPAQLTARLEARIRTLQQSKVGPEI